MRRKKEFQLNEKNFKDKKRERNQCKLRKISSERNKNSKKKN